MSAVSAPEQHYTPRRGGQAHVVQYAMPANIAQPSRATVTSPIRRQSCGASLSSPQISVQTVKPELDRQQSSDRARSVLRVNQAQRTPQCSPEIRQCSPEIRRLQSAEPSRVRQRDDLPQSRKAYVIPVVSQKELQSCQDVLSLSQKSMGNELQGSRETLNYSGAGSLRVQRSSSTGPRSSSTERLPSHKDFYGCEDALSLSMRSVAMQRDESEHRASGLRLDQPVVADPLKRSTGSIVAPVGVEEKPSVSNIKVQLTELQTILAEQYGQADFSGEHKDSAIFQAQLVERVASEAPESKLRDLCAIIAGQQAKQESMLWVLQSTVDKLQQQVKVLWNEKLEKQTEDMSIRKQAPKEPAICQDDCQSPAASDKSTVDAETDPGSLGDAFSEQEADMKVLNADVVFSAIKETVGVEIVKHEESIKQLNKQMLEINDFTEKGLSCLTQLLTEALATRPSPAPAVSTSEHPKEEGILGTIKELGHRTPPDPEPLSVTSLQPSSPGFTRGLHTIAEAKYESDGDTSEMRKKVKSMYQDIINRSSKKVDQLIKTSSEETCSEG